jgi:hypothetical protein
MNAKADTALSSSPCLDAATESDKFEQRARNLRAFQEKYDAMLYIIEFIAKYHQANPLVAKQDKRGAELQGLALRARQEIRELTQHTG